MDYKLSIVFGYRDRDLDRVRRCLDSLARQTLNVFQVVFVDYGSTTTYRDQIEDLLSKYPFCQYLYTHSRGMFWNRSKALNVGLKMVQTTFVAFSDVDIIFPETFIERLIPQLSEKKVVYTYCYNLARNFNNWASLPKVNAANFRENTAKGLFQCIPTSQIKSIHGFDERYFIWGVEDEDLGLRLQKMGLTEAWIEGLVVYHQWHPHAAYRTMKFPAYWHESMVAYKKQQEGGLIRNPTGWGEVQKEANRLTSDEGMAISKFLKYNQVSPYRFLLDLNANFLDLKAGEVLELLVEDDLFLKMSRSRLVRFIQKANSIFDRLNLGLMLTNDLKFYKRYYSVEDYRDVICYFLFQHEITDYHIEMKESEIHFRVLRNR